MSDKFNLNVVLREVKGKGASRRLRREEKAVPAIVYGAGKDPVMISLRENEVRKATENEAFFSHILTLDLGGNVLNAVVKDIQRHPARQDILHMDFLRISSEDPIIMRVPLHLIGEDIAVGVKQGGGLVSRLMNEIEIKCLPKDLPSAIELDISALDVGQSLHLSDLKVAEGIDIIALTHGEEQDHPVVSIHLPRAEKEEEAVAEDAEAEGEAAGDEKADKAEGSEKPEGDKG